VKVASATDAATFNSAALKLRRFWSWWSGELVAWVPMRLRAAARFLNDSTFIEIEGKRIQAKRYREGRLQSLDEMDLTKLPLAERPLALRAWLSRAVPVPDHLALVLSPGEAISRRIELPRAAEENLRQAIAYELNRYTPFRASDVYFDYRVLKRVPGERGLNVQIAVAPKTRVDPSLSLLAIAGVRPAAVVLGDDLSAALVPLNLLPLDRRVNTTPRISASNSLLVALALILFAAALAVPVLQKRQAIAALNPLVEVAKREAEGADRLKKELDTLVEIYDFLLQRKHTYPAATIVMDELTRVLPDGTWLQQLNLRSHPKGWEIQLQGETTISSRLASVMEDSPLFRDAGFKSPLIKGQAPASERFHLGAELEPVPAPKVQRLADKRPPALAAAVRTVEPPAADSAPRPGSALAPPPLAAPRP
jgi:general secretion pathway protein L